MWITNFILDHITDRKPRYKDKEAILIYPPPSRNGDPPQEKYGVVGAVSHSVTTSNKTILYKHSGVVITVDEAKKIHKHGDSVMGLKVDDHVYIDLLDLDLFKRDKPNSIISLDGDFTLDYLKALVVLLDNDKISNK